MVKKCRQGGTERIMTGNKLAKLHKIYSIILAVLISLCGVCLAISAIHIYLTGDAPHYSREVVGKYLVYNIPILALVILGVTGNVVIDILLPKSETERLRAFQSARAKVRRMGARMKFACMDDVAKEALAKEKKKRSVMFICYGIGLGILLVPIVLWLCDLSHFGFPYQNADVITFLMIAIPLAFVGMVGGYVVWHLCEKSYERALAVMKSQAKKDGIFQKEEDGPSALECACKKYRLIAGVRVAVLVVGIAFVILGIFNEGAVDVFNKAVKICMECIGLG